LESVLDFLYILQIFVLVIFIDKNITEQKMITPTQQHYMTHLSLSSSRSAAISLSTCDGSLFFRPKQPPLVTLTTHIPYLEVYGTLSLN
jgi:hypothetical protein